VTARPIAITDVNRSRLSVAYTLDIDDNEVIATVSGGGRLTMSPPKYNFMTGKIASLIKIYRTGVK